MKTIVTTLALALCAATGVTAQMKSAAPAPGADSVLLSETTEGDYIVRRYLVRSSGDADFTMHYRISLATLDTSLGGNPKQLGDLNAFLSGLVGDTLRKVQSVTITGYSSPDGPVQLNEKLAAQRAQDFMAYANGKYGLSKRYTVRVNSVAEDWTMCRALVAQSQIPDRTAVLQIIDGAQTPEQKELALEKLPAAWNYMKANILPPLRRVEVMIAYADGNIVEQRTLKPKPAPAPAPAPETYEVVDETITGVIVEMPESKREMREEHRAAAREAKQDATMTRREAREAARIAKRDAREAKKIERRSARAAEKMAKKEAKAAKKAAKAMQKNEKDLEKM